jgi:hypothetical protein
MWIVIEIKPTLIDWDGPQIVRLAEELVLFGFEDATVATLRASLSEFGGWIVSERGPSE